MTIDEAIEQFKYDAKNNRVDLDISYAEENEQIAEWLEELKALRHDANEWRKAGYEHGYSDGYKNAIDEAYMKAKTLMYELQFMNSGRSNGKTHRLYCIQALEFLRQVAEQLKEGGENAGRI